MMAGETAVLVIDDTAPPKKGANPGRVAPQQACAAGPRLFLPRSRTGEPDRMKRAHVPQARFLPRTKPRIALDKIALDETGRLDVERQ